ncbi:MAG: aliphatic sulfonate ABC transporter substrate-binding protein [Methylocystis sp.]|nr:aliphatic sulfonate ABC transporter substrate-binding protein [Methylocystis sp.]MCA3583126.1 aliphatic sulfonate ABC transporter substrate-binding protein [Methylocystis sp.]MCA3587669.1 aliphatic sulfonate ABC transporter substrate-binding protein [Methylocystis sp.]MCA3590796.1 aliphatic sulfonate ABC transporter substrate-binding protein [Methylocystis sp.]
MSNLSRRTFSTLALTTALAFSAGVAHAQAVKEIRLDFATYNPVSLLLKERGLLEKEFAADGISIRWVQSLGSNKALEFLNASSIDFGSTAGAAALLGRVGGNPIKAVYVFSRPEWTALVTTPKTGIKTVADLKGKRVAVTRGTDPHIFLIRALQEAKLTEKDVRLVLLQHQDGRTALERGDVDAWAGLDPLMAAAEVESGATLFYRNPGANTLGVLNVREEFARTNPALVDRVLKVYEEGRKLAIAEPASVKQVLITATKLPDAVITRQLERTDFSDPSFTPARKQTIIAAGLALQEAGLIKPDVDVRETVRRLIDDRPIKSAQVQ